MTGVVRGSGGRSGARGPERGRRATALLAVVAAAALLPPACSGEGERPAPPTASGAASEPDAWAPTPSAVCATCHPEQHKQYSSSLMGRSATSALFLAVLRAYEARLGDKLNTHCFQCHSPSAAARGSARMTTVEDHEGVSCSFCHSIVSARASGDGLSVGGGAYELAADRTIFGAAPPEIQSPYHRIQTSDLFRSSELCLGCHGVERNVHGLAVCVTGQEHEEHRRKTGSTATCQSCHMPEYIGKRSILSPHESTLRSHSFHGAAAAELASRAARMALSVARRGGEIVFTVEIENLTGHGLPTGVPERFMALRLEGRDAEGGLVWTREPAGGDDTFRVVFAGADGKAGAPGRFAASVLSDSRMKPAERRRVELRVGAASLPAGVVRVRAHLGMREFRPERLRDLHVTDAEWTEEHTVTAAEAALERR